MKKKHLFLLTNNTNLGHIVPIIRELTNYRDLFIPRTIHTGTHYPSHLKQHPFFSSLNETESIHLGLSESTPSQNTARTQLALDAVLQEKKADAVLLEGSSNSTLGACLVARQENIPIFHLNTTQEHCSLPNQPCPIHDLIAQLASVHYPTSPDIAQNLLKKGLLKKTITYVGNPLTDTLHALKNESKQSPFYKTLGLKKKSYILLNIRKSHAIKASQAHKKSIQVLASLCHHKTVIALHPLPNTPLFNPLNEKKIDLLPQISPKYPGILNLIQHANAIITDNDTFQLEAYFYKTPCFTLFDTKTRTISASQHTAIPLPKTTDTVMAEYNKKKYPLPPLWDGKAAARVVKHLIKTMIL